MGKTLFVFFFGCTFLVSCGDGPCGKAFALVGLVGFQDQELDTVTLHKYVKGSRLTASLDSMVFTRSAHHFQRSGDTVMLLEPNSHLTSDVDYILTLPKAGRDFRLTEIYEPLTNGGYRKTYCINPIRSYQLDDKLVQGKDNYGQIYFVK